LAVVACGDSKPEYDKSGLEGCTRSRKFSDLAVAGSGTSPQTLDPVESESKPNPQKNVVLI